MIQVRNCSNSGKMKRLDKMACSRTVEVDTELYLRFLDLPKVALFDTRLKIAEERASIFGSPRLYKWDSYRLPRVGVAS
jgi:hypothetical protein